MDVKSATILICTHRRPALLAETLAAVNQLQRPADCHVEVIVVDNRSNDETPQVIARAAEAHESFLIRHAFEPVLGKSYALNRGLALATGDIVALTDDDILLCAGWLDRIVSHFRSDANVQFVFGKVLPRWEVLPSAEFTDRRMQPSWGPLGLLDLGDSVLRYVDDAEDRRHPIGGNVAFRRQALATIGGWRVDLGKVNNSLICGEDHEIFLRLKRYGLYVGVYDPEIVVRHFIGVTKLSRSHFRRWFYWRGKTVARMAEDVYRPIDLTRCARIAGVPRFLLRQFIEQLGSLVRHSILGDPVDRLVEQVQTAQYLGMFTGFFRLWLGARISGFRKFWHLTARNSGAN